MGSQANLNLTFETGDLLRSPADILVCPVSGYIPEEPSGLQGSFGEAFTKFDELYRFAAESAHMIPGQCRMVKARLRRQPECGPGARQLRVLRDIVLFPTRLHPSNHARYDWLCQGLASLYPILARHEPETERIDIAMPILGIEDGLNGNLALVTIMGWAYGLPPRYHVTIYGSPE